MIKELVILGAGESGVGAALLAKHKGLIPFVSDGGKIKQKYKDVLIKNEIEWEEGQHDEARILNASEIVKSPGIPDTIALIVKAKERGILVVSEIEFAYRYCNAKIIAITGSNGKTTTAMMTYHVLKSAGVSVGLAGNVGESFAAQLIGEQKDWYVLELSSFQLDGIKDFRAEVAILLNITADHLDRYENSLQKYADSKLRIVKNAIASDVLIYCKDDKELLEALTRNPTVAKLLPFSQKEEIEEGAFIEKENLKININNNHFIMSIHDLAVQGKHNLYNTMASGIASRVLDLRKELIRDSLSDFQNVEHRLEFVASVHGIEFINDSKATNVNSTWYALESQKKEVVWIVGGVDKGNDYSMLDDLVKDKVKAIICLGTDNKKIQDAFGGMVETIVESASATEAVRKAYDIGSKGDAVLLSPACASFDLFENYEDRGHQFKRAVKSL